MLILSEFSYKNQHSQKENSESAHSPFCYLRYLSTTLCIAQQNLSIGVNVVSKGSPSRIFRVLLISLGITILPKSSTRRTSPVAVPGVLLADGAAASLTDRGHSLRSLLPPPAALPSLPSCFHNFSISFTDS